VILPEDKDQIARSMTEKLLAYSTSAAPTKVGKPDIETIVRNVRDKKYGFKSLVTKSSKARCF
jgi:hypothetical protein